MEQKQLDDLDETPLEEYIEDDDEIAAFKAKKKALKKTKKSPWGDEFSPADLKEHKLTPLKEEDIKETIVIDMDQPALTESSKHEQSHSATTDQASAEKSDKSHSKIVSSVTQSSIGTISRSARGSASSDSTSGSTTAKLSSSRQAPRAKTGSDQFPKQSQSALQDKSAPEDGKQSNEPINPWADEHEQPSTSGGWIIVSVILGILLIIAVFTGGFGLMKDPSELTQVQAEQKVLSYVNSNLLRPGIQATLASSKDAGKHYLITLDVGGEVVDTYISKDGALFFPQGFDTSRDLVSGQPEPSASDQSPPLSSTQPDPADSKTPVSTATQSQPSGNPAGSGSGPSSSSPSLPGSSQPSSKTTELTLSAKRWVFDPAQLSANAGDHIRLSINPQSITFTFAIADLGIEKEISELTVIEFDVPKSGSYRFTCQSCEDIQKNSMNGLLVVE